MSYGPAKSLYSLPLSTIYTCAVLLGRGNAPCSLLTSGPPILCSLVLVSGLRFIKVLNEKYYNNKSDGLTGKQKIVNRNRNKHPNLMLFFAVIALEQYLHYNYLHFRAILSG